MEPQIVDQILQLIHILIGYDDRSWFHGFRLPFNWSDLNRAA
jgi:hypothetical protein